MINSPDDLRCQRRLANLDELQAKARNVNRRLRDTERVGQGYVLASPAFVQALARNGRYARKVVGACKSERARRLYRAAPLPQGLEQLVRAHPSALKVNVDDMQRVPAQARPVTRP
jgi:hypothetical protein